MAKRKFPDYDQWDNIYAAHRAFTDRVNRQERITTFPAAEQAMAHQLINRATEDFHFFSSLVDIQDITSIEPFLINAAARLPRARLARQEQSPYSDEITGRALDMPLRMAYDFFVRGQPAPRGQQPDTAIYSIASRSRTITHLERSRIKNFREVLLLGKKRLQKIEGLGTVTLGQTVNCIKAIDARLEIPKDTYPGYAALLYGDISEVPARAITDITPEKTDELTVGDMLNMPLATFNTTFGIHASHIHQAAVAFENTFNESAERRLRLEKESQLTIASSAPPSIELPPS